MAAQEMTFAKLMAPVSLDEFLDTYFGKKPLHISGSREKTGEVCDWVAFNDLLQMTDVWSSDNFKMVLDTETLPASDYCRRTVSRDNFGILQPDRKQVGSLLDEGATIVLDRVERLSRGVRSVTEAIEMGTCSRVSCNAYCSQEQHKAFPSHFDTTDVFAVHVEGRKTWRIYTGRFEHPMERDGFRHPSFTPEYHEKAKGELLMEVELKPGDILYLPPGVYHDALASTEACLHLSFTLSGPTGLDYLQFVLSGLEDLPIMRQVMPSYDDPHAHQRHLDKLVAEVSEIIGQADTGSQFRKMQHEKAHEALSDVALPHRRGQTMHRVRARGARVVRRGKESQMITAVGKAALPDNVEPMVKWMFERDYFKQSDLAESFPDVPKRARLELIQSLESVDFLESL